jgi:hypothetical protein
MDMDAREQRTGGRGEGGGGGELNVKFIPKSAK